jgi:transposase
MVGKTLERLELSEEELAILERGSKSRSDLRLRGRSQTILWFHEGVQAKEIACRLGLTLEAVYERRYRWHAKRLLSLRDAPGRGAPGKLSEEMLVDLKGWATEEALNARELLTRLQEKFDIQVHLNTVKNALKRAGCVWKRTRHSVKKKGSAAL